MNFADIFILVLTALMTYAGFRKGLAASLVSMLSILLGVPVSASVSNRYSSFVYDNYFKQHVLDNLTKSLNEQGGVEELVKSINDTMSQFPMFFAKDIDISTLNSLSNDNVAAYVESHIAEPIMLVVIEVMIFFVVFSLFGIACAIVSAVLKRLNKKKGIPFSNTNRILGAVFGLIKAFVIVVVLSFAAYFIIENTNNKNEFVSLLEGSVIIDFVNIHNPLI